MIDWGNFLQEPKRTDESREGYKGHVGSVDPIGGVNVMPVKRTSDVHPHGSVSRPRAIITSEAAVKAG